MAEEQMTCAFDAFEPELTKATDSAMPRVVWLLLKGVSNLWPAGCNIAHAFLTSTRSQRHQVLLGWQHPPESGPATANKPANA